jgi:hypothetical protein
MKAHGIPGLVAPPSTSNTLDELLVNVGAAPQMGISQPASSGIEAAYKQDPEVVGGHQVGQSNSMANPEHGLHCSNVSFSVIDKGLFPCMGGKGGEKQILTSVTASVFRGAPPPSHQDYSLQQACTRAPRSRQAL